MLQNEFVSNEDAFKAWGKELMKSFKEDENEINIDTKKIHKDTIALFDALNSNGITVPGELKNKFNAVIDEFPVGKPAANNLDNSPASIIGDPSIWYYDLFKPFFTTLMPILAMGIGKALVERYLGPEGALWPTIESYFKRSSENKEENAELLDVVTDE